MQGVSVELRGNNPVPWFGISSITARDDATGRPAFIRFGLGPPAGPPPDGVFHPQRLTWAMEENLPVLYVKTGCPWCQEVRDFMMGHGLSHREVNVTDDPAGYNAMQRLSGQSKAPTLDWHGAVLADFGVEELTEFLHQHDVVLEDS